jgi:DNA-binding NtrC family response regulator
MPAPEPRELLIVDSDPAIRALLAVIGERHGWQPVPVGDATAAAKLLRERTFAAAVIDVRTPKPADAGVLHELAATQPALLDRTLVLTTGRLTLEGPLERVAAVLQKPFHLDGLTAALQRCRESLV